MQLIVDKLEKSFGVQEVFKDVSFMIAKGEKIGLVGVNGSGKSTLVKCLLRPDYADRGTVSFEPGSNMGMWSRALEALAVSLYGTLC